MNSSRSQSGWKFLGWLYADCQTAALMRKRLQAAQLPEPIWDVQQRTPQGWGSLFAPYARCLSLSPYFSVRLRGRHVAWFVEGAGKPCDAATGFGEALYAGSHGQQIVVGSC